MQALPISVEQLVGQTFGNFRVDRLLGRGALSAVYRAYQSGSERRVLLTVFLLPAWCEEPQRTLFMERFSKIASVLVTLDHPHITATYGFGEQFGYPYLVTDFLEEVSLASVLKQQTRCTPMQTLALLKQIAEALDYAHEHDIVHGALRPANILLDSQQNVHITGMGLARILEMRDIGVTQRPLPHLYSIAETLLYSPEYLAPEVVEGQPVDARSDMYALGCILYELLCGRTPFSGDDPIAVAMQHVQQPIPSLQSVYALAPAALDLIVQRTLEREPARRYQSARKLAGVFERVLNVLDAAASPSGAWRNPGWLLDISERPTLPWFEADSSGVVQWSPLLSSKVSAVSLAPGIRPVMPPAVPWNAVRSAVEDANRQDNTSVVQLSSQPTAEMALVQSSASSTVEPNERAASAVKRRGALFVIAGGIVATSLLAFGGLGMAGILPSNVWPGHNSTTVGAKNTVTSDKEKNAHPTPATKVAPSKPAPKPTVAPTPTPAATATSAPAVAMPPQPAVTPTTTPTVAPTPTPTPEKKSKKHNG